MRCSYKCEHCAKPVAATKELAFRDVPPLFVVHLKARRR
jgi:hypothetical protein